MEFLNWLDCWILNLEDGEQTREIIAALAELRRTRSKFLELDTSF